jgi:hypothetical protein
VPFVSFIVLAGNAIATSSNTDLALLSSVVSMLASTAANSPAIQKMHDACERFSRISSLIVLSANKSSLNHQEYQEQASNNGLPPDGSTNEPDMLNHPHMNPIDYGFPMAQQDWDSVMIEFGSELGNYDSRTLTNIIEPYIANAGW